MRTLSFIPTVVALLAIASIYGQTQPPANGRGPRAHKPGPT